MLEILANVSRNLRDVTIINFKTTGRMLRWTDRVWANKFFKDNLPQVGLVFQSLLQLNLKVKLLPEYVPGTKKILPTIKYKTTKYFDLDAVLKTLKDMDLATW